MVCTSASINKIANSSPLAQEEIDKLIAKITEKEKACKDIFLSRIETSLNSAKIPDAKSLSYGSNIITEYISESNLDQIKAAVSSEIKKIQSIENQKNTLPETNPEIIDSYADMVNSVKESAKASSGKIKNMSFTMQRLSPGLFVFFYASSMSAMDKKSFGSETVTTTILFYKLIFSLEDIKKQAAFDAYQIDKQTYIKLKEEQAKLLDKLTDGSINLVAWQKLDEKFKFMVEKAKAKLDANPLD